MSHRSRHDLTSDEAEANGRVLARPEEVSRSFRALYDRAPRCQFPEDYRRWLNERILRSGHVMSGGSCVQAWCAEED